LQFCRLCAKLAMNILVLLYACLLVDGVEEYIFQTPQSIAMEAGRSLLMLLSEQFADALRRRALFIVLMFCLLAFAGDERSLAQPPIISGVMSSPGQNRTPVVRPAGFVVGPVIDSFLPSSGNVGTVVTITGSSFSGATAVKFHGVFAVAQNVSDTSVTAVVPAATTGPISVITPSGTGVSADSFIVGPIITGFTPSSASVGGIVKIFGKNFTGATAVGFNGAITVPFNISDTNLSAAVPAGATSGAISVTTPSGTGSSSENFIAPPRITGFDPASGSVGTLVTIGGTNFTGATAVKFHGVAAKTFSVDSDTVIKVTVPDGATTGSISVTTPLGTAVSSGIFTAGPVVGSLNPTSGTVGTVVTITGKNFDDVTGVTFNGVSASTFTMLSAVTITAAVPSGAGVGPVTVTTSAGAGISASSFTVLPGIASFTPLSGPAGALVTITGTNFTGATAVKFHGVAAKTFSVDSDTVIKAVAPPGATTGQISVIMPSGTGTSFNNFTVTAGVAAAMAH